MPTPPNDPPPRAESAPDPFLGPTHNIQLRGGDDSRRPPRTASIRLSVRYEQASREQHQQAITILSDMLQDAEARLRRRNATLCQDEAA